MGLAWTDEIRWDQLVDVSKVPGDNWDERFSRAQKAVVEKGGGVIAFPYSIVADDHCSPPYAIFHGAQFRTFSDSGRGGCA